MQKISFKALVFAMLGFGSVQLANAQEEARLMRFPDINKNLIAFVYAGDIWTVDANGGEARRLTSHPGMELFPKISPDGKWIAFSGEYSGSRQIFIMPASGGTPKQLTYYNSVGLMPPRGGFDDVPLDWTSDSKNILFRANRTPFGDRNGKYFMIGIDGGLEKSLPIVNGGFAALSPDNKRFVSPRLTANSAHGNVTKVAAQAICGFTTWRKTLRNKLPISKELISFRFGLATTFILLPTAT